MDAGWAMVVAAAITAVGGVVVTLLQRFRKENQRDHEVVAGLLKMMHRTQQRTEQKLGKVDEKLQQHIESHHHN